MSNFHIERLIYILSPFLGAHLVAAILTYPHFKFKCDRLSSWKEGAWVYLGMTAFQMIFEYYYFKMVPGERLAFRLETDIIIGWSAFFGMITYPISSREIKKRMKSDHQRIQPYSWIKRYIA